MGVLLLSCLGAEIIRKSSNYSMCGGWGALRALPQFLKWLKNVGYLDKSQAIVNYFYQSFERN